MPLVRLLSLLIVLVLVVRVTADPGTQALPEKVGDYGDPERLVFRGLKKFTPKQIRNALIWDSNWMLAAHPRARMSFFLELTQAKIQSGLLHTGFAESDVKVVADLTGKQLVVSIHEGDRYRNGAVQIDGLKTIDKKRLVQRLTAPFLKKEAVAPVFQGNAKEPAYWNDKDGKKVDLADPIWKAGDPAKLAAENEPTLRRQIEAAFNDLGYPSTKFDVYLLSDRKLHTADLVVTVTDEGPKAVVEEIEIVGNKKNSRQEILDYLKLKPGTLVSHREQARLEYTLWRSARFVKHSITTELPELTGEKVKLRLELEEYSQASKLNQPLSREGQAMLKARDWLVDQQKWNGDLVVKVTGPDDLGAIDVSFSAQGMIVTYASATDSRALIASKDRVGYYSPSERRKFEIPITKGRVTAPITLSYAGEQDETPYKFFAGLGYTSDRDEDELPFAVSLDVSPVYMLALLDRLNKSVKWQGDVLAVTGEDSTIRVNAKTGQLVECRMSDLNTRISFTEKGFQTLVNQADSKIAKCVNGYQPGHVLSSAVRFIFQEEAFIRAATTKKEPSKKEPTTKPVLTGVGRILEYALYGIEDYWASEEKIDDEDKFSIPKNYAAMGDWLTIVKLAAVPCTDMLFPRRSWAWTICREAAWTSAGQGVYTGTELSLIYHSPKSGPLCLLSIAELMTLGGKQELTQYFAKRGLEFFTAERFQSDVVALLDQKSAIGKLLFRTGEIIRKLNDSEVEELLRAMPHNWSFFRAITQELRTNTTVPLESAIPAAMNRAWSAGLSDIVEQRLRLLAGEPAFQIGQQKNAPVQR